MKALKPGRKGILLLKTEIGNVHDDCTLTLSQPRPGFYIYLHYKSFGNSVGKGDIARLFQQCLIEIS